jgi:hypothetical protein
VALRLAPTIAAHRSPPLHRWRAASCDAVTPLTPMHQTEAACTPVTKSYRDGRRALDDLGRVKTGARATLTAAMRRLTSQIAPLPLGTTFEDVVRVSSWPPTTNGTPVLSVDDYPDTLLAQYIGASESHEGELHSLAVNLARIADKAVREYRAAGEYLSAFVETPGVESIEATRSCSEPSTTLKTASTP